MFRHLLSCLSLKNFDTTLVTHHTRGSSAPQTTFTVCSDTCQTKSWHHQNDSRQKRFATKLKAIYFVGPGQQNRTKCLTLKPYGKPPSFDLDKFKDTHKKSGTYSSTYLRLTSSYPQMIARKTKSIC